MVLKSIKKLFFPIATIFIMFFLMQGNYFLPAELENQDKILSHENMEGIILDSQENENNEKKFEILITQGEEKGKTVVVSYLETAQNNHDYQEKDKVVVIKTQGPNNTYEYFINDYVRNTQILIIVLIFIAVLIFSSRLRGIQALIGMSGSIVIIFKITLPLLFTGHSPLVVVLFSSALIIPITFYLSHGFNRKTHIAVLSTFITLTLASILAIIFTEISHLSGLSSEEFVYLSDELKSSLNHKGLLLAGMIISMLGVLDDVSISQSSVVEEIRKNNPKIKFKKLYSSAMNVGQDHIASMVNTLILVYTGASLPLLLLFIDYSENFLNVINYEFLAVEIIQTLIGSIGLVIAVPLTTLLAAKIKPKK